MPPRVILNIAELQSLVGSEIGASDWCEVSQTLIDAFAELTHDQQWIHVDPERARRESPYGATVAHGFLTLSLLSHLHRQVVQIQGDYSRGINYGFNRLRFPAAVPAGARIRVRSKLQAVKEVVGGVECVWDVTLEIEGKPKPAIVAEWLTRLYR